MTTDRAERQWLKHHVEAFNDRVWVIQQQEKAHSEGSPERRRLDRELLAEIDQLFDGIEARHPTVCPADPSHQLARRIKRGGEFWCRQCGIWYVRQWPPKSGSEESR
jgi:hypothetical protein